MRSLASLVALLLVIPLAAAAQSTTWQSTDGPPGGGANALWAYGEQSLLAGALSGAGVFRSTDAGRTWTPLGTDFPGTSVLALHRTPLGAVYAGTPDGVVRLAPGEAAWADLSDGLPEARGVFSFTEAADGTLFAAGFGAVYQLAPGAGAWTATGLTADANTLFTGVGQTADGRLLAARRDGAVFRSADAGATWTAVGALPGGTGPAAFVRDGDGTLYAAAGTGGVARSADDGDTWTSAGTGLSGTDVTVTMLADDGTLYVGTRSDGVFRLTGDGDAWEPLSLFLPENTAVAALAATGAGEVFAGLAGRAGLYRLDDTDRWNESNDGFAATVVHALAFVQGGVLTAGTDDQGVLVAEDVFFGAGWARWSAGLEPYGNDVSALASNGEDTLYAGTPFSGVLRSADGGGTWTLTGGVGDDLDVTALLLQDDGDLFAGTDDEGVYRLREGDDAWTAAGAGLPPEVHDLAGAPDGTLYAATDDGLWRSADDGETWEDVTGPLPGAVTAVLVTEAGRLYAAAFETLQRSDDAGATWADVTPPTGLSLFTFPALAHDRSETLFAARSSFDVDSLSTVHRSTDGGDTWQTVADGLPNAAIEDLAVLTIQALKAGGRAEPYVFAATSGAGVWLLEGDPGTSTEAPERPAAAALAPAYPNPFTGRTTLAYTLARPAPVRLAVYDLLGRTVAVLVDAVQPAGAHRAVFEAGALPGGVYFVRLEAGPHRASRALLRVR